MVTVSGQCLPYGPPDATKLMGVAMQDKFHCTQNTALNTDTCTDALTRIFARPTR